MSLTMVLYYWDLLFGLYPLSMDKVQITDSSNTKKCFYTKFESAFILYHHPSIHISRYKNSLTTAVKVNIDFAVTMLYCILNKNYFIKNYMNCKDLSQYETAG
jgi:hypothetical protein